MRWLVLFSVTLLVSGSFVMSAQAQDPNPDPDLPDPDDYIGWLPPIPDDPSSIDPADYLPGSGEEAIGIIYTWLPPEAGFSLPKAPVNSTDPNAGPSEYMHVAWNDAQHVSAIARDGYDLRSLAVWEYDDEAQGAGVMLRLAMDGGRLTGDAYRYIIAMEIAVENGTPVPLAWQSLDGGATWAGDGAVIDVNASMQDANDLGAIQATVMHVHLPYAALGAAPGVNLTGFEAWSWTQSSAQTEEVPIDIAPGGAYLAGSAAEVPEPGDSSAHLSTTAPVPPPYYLRGPGRHLDFAGAWGDGVTALQFGNPYGIDQMLAIAAPAGFVPRAHDNVTYSDGVAHALIPASGDIVVVYDVPRQSQSQQITWQARSDFGGIAELSLVIPALPPPPPVPTTTTAPVEPEPAPEIIPVQRTDKVLAPPKPPAPAAESEDSPEGEDSPIGVWVVGAAILVAVAIRRKH